MFFHLFSFNFSCFSFYFFDVKHYLILNLKKLKYFSLKKYKADANPTNFQSSKTTTKNMSRLMNQSQLDDAWYEFGPVDWVWAEQLKLDEHEEKEQKKREMKPKMDQLEQELKQHMEKKRELGEQMERLELKRYVEKEHQVQKLMEHLEKDLEKREQETQGMEQLYALYAEEHDEQRHRWWLQNQAYWQLYEATDQKLFDIWQSERAEHARNDQVWLCQEHDSYAEETAAFHAKTRHIDQLYHDTLDQLEDDTHYELDVRFHRLDIAFRWETKLKEHQVDRNYQIDRKSSDQEIAEFDEELARINSDHQLEMDYVAADVLYESNPPTTAEAELHDKMWLEIDEMYKRRATDEAHAAEIERHDAQQIAEYYAAKKKAQEKEKS